MKILKLAALAALLGASALLRPALAADPVYSSIKPEDCVLYDLFETGASQACKGAGGYSLAITDADVRIYLRILHPDWSAPAEIDLQQITGGSFSSLPSDVVEWRGLADAPTAMILRLSYNEGDGRSGDQSLVVIRLDREIPGNVCLIGHAPRGADMNAEARALADRAPETSCY